MQNFKLDRMNKLADEGIIRRIKSSNPNKSNLVMFKYIFGLSNWLNPDILDARGIVFNEDTGQVVLRPYRKFFNDGQYSYFRDSTPPEFITNRVELEAFVELTEPPQDYLTLTVEDKLDGSMISFSGGLITSSGSFDSEHVERFERFLRESYGDKFIELFSQFTKEKNVTFIFEYINPDFNPIVVEYPEEMIILHGVINNEDGSDNEDIYRRVYLDHFKRPDEYEVKESDLDEFMEGLENKNVEGIVLKYRTKNGVFRLKRKTKSYFKQHSINTSLGLSSKASIRAVLENMFDDEFDDVESQLTNITEDRIKNLEIIRHEFEYWQKLEVMLLDNPDWIEKYKSTGEEKKQFVEEVRSKVPNFTDLFALIVYSENKTEKMRDKILTKITNKTKELIDKEKKL